MFEQTIYAITRQRARALEQACEAAMQTGLYGVLLYRDAAGVEHVGPDPRVPYGMIHEYPDGLPEDF
jgi:hypothetical protein